MSWEMASSKSQVTAAKFLGTLSNYELKEYSYLEGMCIHWELLDLKNGEILMPETCVIYFGKPAWEIKK